MRKTSLITAILLLSAVWAVAQTSPSSPQSTMPGASSQQPTSPSTTSPSQQPATPDTTQTSTDSANSIEGCLSGSAGNWTLTDQSGKTWQLAGDTSKLSDHVGHQVRISGDNSAGSSPSSGSSGAASATNPSSGAGATGAGSSSGSQSTFNVKKVKMISSTCSTTSK